VAVTCANSEVSVERGDGLRTDGHQAPAAGLRLLDEDHAPVEVNVGHLQRGELPAAHPCVDEQAEDGVVAPVAELASISARRRVLGDDCRRLFLQFRVRHPSHDVLRLVLGDEPSEPLPQPPVPRAGGAARPMLDEPRHMVLDDGTVVVGRVSWSAFVGAPLRELAD
jgi:hypothetical protein